MNLGLTQRDYGVIAAILVGGLAVMLVTALSLGPTFENTSRFYIGAVLLLGTYIAYKLHGTWGGKVGKGFMFVAVSLLIMMFQYVLHIGWHLDAAAQVAQGGSPYLAWLGIPGQAWLAFFHGTGAGLMVLMGYGFYILWEAGHPGE